METIVTFNDSTPEQVKEVGGTILSVPWAAVLPRIEESIRLRDDEQIIGLIVSDVDIRVKVGRKRKRRYVKKQVDSPELELKETEQ